VNTALLNSTSQASKRTPSSTQWVLKTSHSITYTSHIITITKSIPSLQLCTTFLFYEQ